VKREELRVQKEKAACATFLFVIRVQKKLGENREFSLIYHN